MTLYRSQNSCGKHRGISGGGNGCLGVAVVAVWSTLAVAVIVLMFMIFG